MALSEALAAHPLALGLPRLLSRPPTHVAPLTHRPAPCRCSGTSFGNTLLPWACPRLDESFSMGRRGLPEGGVPQVCQVRRARAPGRCLPLGKGLQAAGPSLSRM